MARKKLAQSIKNDIITERAEEAVKDCLKEVMKDLIKKRLKANEMFSRGCSEGQKLDQATEEAKQWFLLSLHWATRHHHEG